MEVGSRQTCVEMDHETNEKLRRNLNL